MDVNIDTKLGALFILPGDRIDTYRQLDAKLYPQADKARLVLQEIRGKAIF
jgi:Flp pilus assembly protein CpaB